MFDHLGEHLGHVIERGAHLFEAKSHVLLRSFERAGAAAASYVGLAILMAGGALTLLAAGAVALAPYTGTAGALGIVGAAAVMGGLIGVSMVKKQANPEPREPRRTMAELKREVLLAELSFKEALHPKKKEHHESPAAGAGGFSMGNAAHTVQEFIKRPEVIGSAVFAALAVLGPFKALKLARTGVKAAGLAASMSGPVMSAINAMRARGNGRTSGPNTPDDLE